MYKKPCCIFFLCFYGNQTNKTETELNLKENQLNQKVEEEQIIKETHKSENKNNNFKKNVFYVVFVLIVIILIYVMVWLLKKPAELNESERLEEQINKSNEAEIPEQQSDFFLQREVNKFSLLERKKDKLVIFNFPFNDYALFKTADLFAKGETTDGKKTTLPVEWQTIKSAMENHYVFGYRFLIFFYSSNIRELDFYYYDQQIANLINEKITEENIHEIKLYFCKNTRRKTEKTLESKKNITDLMLDIIQNSPTKEDIEEWFEKQEKKKINYN